jgi:hypothetical protein
VSDRPKRFRHDGLEPLPQVEMASLRRLVALVNMLERTEALERLPSDPMHTPEHPMPRLYFGRPLTPGQLQSAISASITNMHLAIKRLVEHPLEAWDRDPLVIRRESDGYHRETEE